MREQILYFLLVLATFQLSLQDPIVKLPNGQILGREDATLEDKSYYSFVKIPYAAPPVGALRFQAPEPAEDWDGILNATRMDVSCMQLMTFSLPRMPAPGTASEDCLFINVYTPKLPSEDLELLPVMVFIHGGGFLFGNSYEDGPDLFINNDVIFVTMNYRLGIFGFVSTQDEVIPGNNGLKDQLLALQWIQSNIRLFNGDPEKVIIFGQSAGAGSCAYHLLNPDSAGLFSGVILESGTFLSPGMFQRNSRDIAFGTAGILNSTFADNQDSQALLDFFKSLDADDLNEAAKQYYSNIQNPWDGLTEPGSPFAPVVEVKHSDAFISEKMYGLLKAGQILSVPTIMGFTSEEKIGEGQNADSFKTVLAAIDEDLEVIVSRDMQITDSTSRTEMGLRIREIYTGGEPFSDHLAEAIRYGSDNFLSRPMIRHAEIFSAIAPTYFYQFSFEGDLDAVSVHYDGAGSVGHGSDRSFLFCTGSGCGGDAISEADVLTRQRLIRLWTNFAKYGNPTPEQDNLLQNVTWPQVSIDDGDFYYLDIDADLEVKNHPKGDAYAEWVELYDSLGYDDFDTY